MQGARFAARQCAQGTGSRRAGGEDDRQAASRPRKAPHPSASARATPRQAPPHCDNENWESIAKRYGVTVRELIANNCGLNVTPEEINWYLHVRVGCNVSQDGKNWSFSKSAKPGVIYVPAAGTIPVSSQNPAINTLYGGPKDLGCGGVEWLVEFKLPKKARAMVGSFSKFNDPITSAPEPEGNVQGPRPRQVLRGDFAIRLYKAEPGHQGAGPPFLDDQNRPSGMAQGRSTI